MMVQRQVKCAASNSSKQRKEATQESNSSKQRKEAAQGSSARKQRKEATQESNARKQVSCVRAFSFFFVSSPGKATAQPYL
jgi:hypothetical protein